MALRGGAKSKIGKARFGKCRLTITPPEFLKVHERRIFRRKKKLAREDPLDPLSLAKRGKYVAQMMATTTMETTTMEKMTTKKSIPNLLSAYPRAEKAPEPILHASWE